MASQVKRVANQEVQIAEESDSDEEEPTIEVVEDGSKGGGSLKPRKRRRLKCYLVFHGDRASRRLPHCVRVKCPRDGSWDNGPNGPRLLKETFVKRYAEVHPRVPLEASSTYLVDEFGTPVADDDKLALYVQSEGVLHVMIGSPAQKGPGNRVIQWGYNSLQSKEALAWGSNEFGQLGTGDELKSAEPVACKVDRDIRLKTVVCGSYYTMALDDKGELWSWGRYQASNWPSKFADTWLQLGIGDEKDGGQMKPREVKFKELTKENPVAALACGGLHTIVALKDGKMFGWGNNSEGQIGHILRKNFGEPQEVSSMEHEPAVDVSCGRYSTLATSDTKCAYFWGSLTGSANQGAPSTGPDGEEKKPDEGEAPDFGGESKSKYGGGAARMLAGAAKQLVGTDVVLGAIGEAHGILHFKNGCLDGWGYNAYGQALGRVDKRTDLIEEPKNCDLGDVYKPSSSVKVLGICTAGGTTTLLVSGEEQD
ncbi:hypothetical protein JL721_1657 [Aureococcus anophagefferens]|nr:hypothetical protein JL721_1657 [Aureococcus anophagefferens]